jgi:hypothetical protein
MTVRKAYSNKESPGCMLFLASHMAVCLVIIILITSSPPVLSQDLPGYDEISVFLDMPEVGGGEIDALIKGTELYLPVTDLFDFLKIKNTSSSGFESISGFFVNKDATYSINRSENRIIYQGQSFALDPGDIIRTESNLYLRSQLFGKVFGLECLFNFRALSVTIHSKLELPLIREMRQEEMRSNINRLKGENKADTTIGRTYPVFKFGMADWAINSTEVINGKTDTRLDLSLGSMIAGGEATANLYYSSPDHFSEKQQNYLWRYVNNDFAPLRQVLAGKIAVNAISSIYNPVVGIQLTNTPTTYRRSFGTYTLSDKTDPGWIVELYVNNVLVDYVKADASGFFTFQVPLVYGNSMVTLKFFGPWGEERVREQNINIPYNFLPVNTFEYVVSAGIVEDSVQSRFSRASMNYGMTRSLTIGGGAEYLSSVTSQPFMPYLNASFRVTNNLLLSGEYAYGVRAKGTLSYRLPSNVQLDLNYTWYDKEQKAIFYNYREERKATLTIPLKLGKMFTFQRFSFYQIVLPLSKYTTGEWIISGSPGGVNTNLTTYALRVEKGKLNLYSNLSMSFRLPGGFVVIPQAQYGYTDNKLYSAKLAIEKHLLEHGFMNLTYEQNFSNNLRLAELGFRFDFSFAQAGASVRREDNKTSLIQYARGSLINDRKTKYLGTDNRTNVGRGGITVTAYLDLNANGKKDPGEPKAFGLNLHASSGRIERSDRDTTVRILGLEPYTSCFIELDGASFENVAWRMPFLTCNVAVDPDIVKLVEIPVRIEGEANGSITLDSEGEKKGLGRIIVNFFTSDLKPAGKTLTEDNGYFSFMGLAPGKYVVAADTSQIRKLEMTSEPGSRQFTIKGSMNGDIAEGLDFVLKPKAAKVVAVAPAVVEKPPVVRMDTTYMKIHEMTEVVYTISEDSWAIQIGAFKDRSRAENFKKMLEINLGKKVEITVAGDYYRVRILDLSTRQEVNENVEKLNKLGFRELWIIRLLANQQQRVLVTREDSLARIKEIKGEAPAVANIPDMVIQLGAFQQRSNAIALRKKLSKEFGKKVDIVFENGYYKIRVTASPLIRQTVREEIKRLMPSVGKLGFKDIWILPFKTPRVEEPTARRTETAPEPVRWNKPVPSPVRTNIPEKPVETKLVLLKIQPEPSIALQVGIFHKESQALRAQRKITSKLDLPVEIVRQFDYYHVLVTGFFTKEETYKYYPELAGMGYPGISLIENYHRQK